ncbi:hypothetical protein OSB04_021815 [Centaurea solstitialis]|uniref:AAA+ ATPase domain-containing protein n=1 Tax=Centaurea solstitialis TaxID=347529 RepID=A0AA38W730_9ASTR|nr:hypothetical protein OSB04_021815 [Centaurea solstitialis]
MAEVISLMEIDDDNPSQLNNNKGKAAMAAAPPAHTKATPWVEKFRPQSLADVAAHRDIIDTIDRLTSENKMPHLLLYGPPGTGKTSTILAVARKLFGVQMHNMVLELNASDERGIDVVRQQIQDFASTQSFSFGLLITCICNELVSYYYIINASEADGYVQAKASVKLVLLDEADAMTKDAQFALRRVIERYTKSTRFALICNNVNKIIPALQSRCTRFRFAPLEASHVTERLKHVITAEGKTEVVVATDSPNSFVPDSLLPAALLLLLTLQNYITCSYRGRDSRSEVTNLAKSSINRSENLFFSVLTCAASRLDVTEDGLAALVRLSNGDMRKALNILQSTHMASQQITEEAVYLCTGNPLPKDIEQISYWLLNEPFSYSFQKISEIKATKGLALVDIVREVTMFVFRIKMPSDVRIQLINDLADVEYRLTFGCNDKLQLGSVIATFTRARSALVAAAK